MDALKPALQSQFIVQISLLSTSSWARRYNPSSSHNYKKTPQTRKIRFPVYWQVQVLSSSQAVKVGMGRPAKSTLWGPEPAWVFAGGKWWHMLLLHYDIKEAKTSCKVPKDAAFAFYIIIRGLWLKDSTNPFNSFLLPCYVYICN